MQLSHDARRPGSVPENLAPVDLVIVGGGQAGLAASYWATRAGLRHVVLDAAPRTGDTWRLRYDSLRLFTPRSHSQLPGLALPGEPSGLPTKDEMATYLEEYVRVHDLPVVRSARVESVRRGDERFEVRTPNETVSARFVMVATGPFHKPRRPEWASRVPVRDQLHSSAYRNPSDVPGPRVLVVGGGNSGAQIAEELVEAGRDVTWSQSAPPRFVPQTILGRNLFWWLDRAGMLTAPGSSRRGRLLQRRGDPIIGTALPRLIRKGRVKLKPTATAPAVDGVRFEDGSAGRFDGIVWSTGFAPDFDLLHLPGALDEDGRPLHDSGVSRIDPRLMFLGLGWLTSRSSGLVGGVGADARRLVAGLLQEHDPITVGTC
jgi:putative flavoprotein involved in K+ transport